MAKYAYTVHSAGGRSSGVVEANSEEEALGKLRGKGGTVLDLRLANHRRQRAEEKSKIAFFKIKERWPVRKQKLELMLRQAGSMLHSGVPIMTVLKTIIRLSPRAFGRHLSRVLQAVREGKTFSKALRAHLPGMDRVTLGLLGVGEANGTLDKMCHYSADLMERTRKLRGQMLQTFSYPAIVVLGAMGIGYYMVRHVFPVVMEFIEGSGRRAAVLPLPTRMVIGLDRFLSVYGVYMILLPVLLVVFVIILRRRRPSGEIIDSLALKIPLLGKAFSFHANTMWCRTLGSMLASGLDILAAVDLTRETMGNWLYAAQFEKVKSAVRNGRSLGESIATTELYRLNPLIHAMVSVSEQGGQLAESLLEAAEFSQDQLNQRVRLLSSLVEPAILLFVGGLVGLVYFGFFMALVSATHMAM